MYVKPILPNQGDDKSCWAIYSPCNSSGVSKLEEFLLSLGPNMHASRIGMIAIFKQISEKGPHALSDAICHQLDKGIWELIKGRIRIVIFTDKCNVVICSHGFLKSTQKTPASEIATAKRCLAKYNQSKREGILKIFREVDNGW